MARDQELVVTGLRAAPLLVIIVIIIIIIIIIIITWPPLTGHAL